MSRDYPFGFVMPSHFSDQQQEALKIDISKLWSLKLQNKLQGESREFKKQVNGLFNRWKDQGVTIDYDFVSEAQQAKKKAESITNDASRLEELCIAALSRKDVIALCYRLNEFGKTAKQVAEAWKQTAALHRQIPGPFSGVILQNRWSEKWSECQRTDRNIKHNLRRSTELLLQQAMVSFDSLGKRQSEFLNEEKWNKVAAVNEAWRRVGLLREEVQRKLLSIEESENAGAFPTESILSDPHTILVLDVTREALEDMIQEAEQVITKSERSDEEDARTTNESLLRTPLTTRDTVEQSSPQEEKLFEMILQFRGHIHSIKKQSEKLFSITDTASNIMSVGDVEFMDRTDLDSLTAAHKKLEVALALLDAVQQRMGDPSKDLFSVEKKKGYVLSEANRAFKELSSAIKALGDENKYEQTQEIKDLLDKLGKLENPIEEHSEI